MAKPKTKSKTDSDVRQAGNSELKLIQWQGRKCLADQNPPASAETLRKAVEKMAVAFPRHEPEFWELLVETFVRHKFSENEVKHVVFTSIDTLGYGLPTVKEIVDARPVKIVMSQSEMMEVKSKTGCETQRIRIDGEWYWIRKDK